VAAADAGLGSLLAQTARRRAGVARAPVEESATAPYVDDFVSVTYDIGYRCEPEGALSKWLQVLYADGTVVDVNIDSIVDESVSPEEAETLKRSGAVGDGGRHFPATLNSGTAPKLAAAKQQALITMDDYNALFILGSFSTVWLILVTAGTAGQAAFGSIPKATRTPLPPRRPASRETGKAPPMSSGEIGGKVIGWGTGQSPAAVAQTRAVTNGLTAEGVKSMIARGLTREWVTQQLTMYRAAIAQGGKKLVNTQLEARKELMEAILTLWPK
jgi:hypothetical protein